MIELLLQNNGIFYFRVLPLLSSFRLLRFGGETAPFSTKDQGPNMHVLASRLASQASAASPPAWCNVQRTAERWGTIAGPIHSIKRWTYAMNFDRRSFWVWNRWTARKAGATGSVNRTPNSVENRINGWKTPLKHGLMRPELAVEAEEQWEVPLTSKD